MTPQSTFAVVTMMLYKKPHFRFIMVHWVFGVLHDTREPSLPMASAENGPSLAVPFHFTLKELT